MPLVVGGGGGGVLLLSIGIFKLGDGRCGGRGAARSAGTGAASVATAAGARLNGERVGAGALVGSRAAGAARAHGRVVHLLSGALLDALDDLLEALLLALALEQATIRVYLLLESGLHLGELVVVGHELLLATAEFANLGLLLVDERLAVLLLGEQQLLDLLDARVQLGIARLHVGDLASLIAHRRAQLACLLARNHGVGRLGASACLHLLDLHAIPLLHLGALVRVDLLVLVADLADGVGQLALEELARVEADVQEALLTQVLELLRVHLAQEAELLLEAVLLVLELHTLQCLRVELGRDALDLAEQTLSLDLVALGLVLEVAEATLEQVDLGLVVGDLLVEVVDARLVGVAVVEHVVVALAEAFGVVLAGARLELGVGLVLARLVDEVLGFAQLDLVHLAYLARLAAGAVLQRLELHLQLLVVHLEEAHALHIARELVVELAELALLLLAILGDGHHRRVLGLERHAAAVEEARLAALVEARVARVDRLDHGAAWAGVAAADRGAARRNVRLVAVDGRHGVVVVGARLGLAARRCRAYRCVDLSGHCV